MYQQNSPLAHLCDPKLYYYYYNYFVEDMHGVSSILIFINFTKSDITLVKLLNVVSYFKETKTNMIIIPILYILLL